MECIISRENNELENLLEKILRTANRQLVDDMSEYLDYKIQNADNIIFSVKYFEYFSDSILRLIESYFESGVFPTTENEFLMEYGQTAINARNDFYDISENYKSKVDMMDKSYEYQLAYYEVYCNGYIRYAFRILFNGVNNEILDKLKKYDVELFINKLKEKLGEYTKRKLIMSYGYEFK